MDYQEENNYPKAFLATGVILAAMLALCYFIIFHNPPPEEMGMGGIVVNYGTTDEGMGKDINSIEQPSVAPKANHTQPNKVTPAPPTEQKSQVDNSDKKVVTQNIEDAPVVDANSKKSTKSVAVAPAQPVKKQVVNRAALYNGPAKSGSGAGDGTTTTPGNQGSKNGSPLAANYGDGGTGNGVKGTQWRWVNHPIFKNPRGIPGRVIIDVTIDANGNIIDAQPNRATRISDLALINSCIEIIKNSKLTSPSPGTGIQKGQVPITFDVE
jgi:outer membrane biosynthesis protein TonB